MKPVTNLPAIFTRKNILILKLLSKHNLHIREIASRLNCSPAKVHGCINIFKKHNIVKEIEDKNKRVIILNCENKLTKQILQLIEMKKEEDNQKYNHNGRISGRISEKLNIFDSISPLDFRYYGRDKKIFEKLQPYLSESAFIKYASRVESALADVFAKYKICSQKVAHEIKNACTQVNPEEVYVEEDKIKHNIRALVNTIRSKVGPKSRPFVHLTTTSYDIISTSDALRYKDFTNQILIPALLDLEATLINLALREKATLQIGRTHGQHAEPITFGFAIANYVSRFGNSIIKIKKTANNLRGKISGAVGAYNSSSLIFEDPIQFEEDVLAELELKSSPTSTQIVEAEFLLEYLSSIISAFGVIANLADDMRHLQRNEIGEVFEYFESAQVGSSTMPQKRNPINFENVKSMWKEFMPRMTTAFMDQISEHQRDLTNSASMRFIPEILAAFYVSVIRINMSISKLAVDKANLQKNFDINKNMIIAEPLYLLLAIYGHPDAHEYVREKTLRSQVLKKPLLFLVKNDKLIEPYMKKFSKSHLEILANPKLYIGKSVEKTERVCEYWKGKFT